MVKAERLSSPQQLRGEDVLDDEIRPRKLCDFIGQQRLKDNLQVFIEAARIRGEPLEHVLLFGPPGLIGELKGRKIPSRSWRAEAGQRVHQGSLVLLVDSGTGGPAELFAAALRENAAKELGVDVAAALKREERKAAELAREAQRRAGTSPISTRRS